MLIDLLRRTTFSYITAFEICLGSRQMRRLLPRHIYVFSIRLGKKKNAEAIEFLGTLKKYFSKNRKENHFFA